MVRPSPRADAPRVAPIAGTPAAQWPDHRPADLAGRTAMKRISNLSMIFARVLGAAAAGCAADPADEAGGGGDDGGGDPGGDAARPLDAAGTYQLQSKLDLASSVPGTAGAVVSKIIEITDGPDD